MYIHTYEQAERKIWKEIHGIIIKGRRRQGGKKTTYKKINIYRAFSGGSAVRTPHLPRRTYARSLAGNEDPACHGK